MQIDTKRIMGAIGRILGDAVDIVVTGLNVITCGLVGRRRATAYRARRVTRRPIL
jgi:hypothetical protein